MEKTSKIMHLTSADTLREVVNIANELGIQREDIVGLLNRGEKYYLVYYYGGTGEYGNPKA